MDALPSLNSRRTRLMAALCGLSLSLAAALPTVYAEESPEAQGLKLAQAASAKDDGFGNSTVKQTMTLRNKQGKESVRRLRVKSLEMKDDGDRSLFVFDSPRDVKGTALLIHAHKDTADDQWLYLPALKRVKRISASNKSGSFMGSEFSYEDLSSQEVEKFTYRYLGDEPCGEMTCLMLERYPAEKDSGYKRQIVWYDEAELRIQQIHFYDRKDTHMKTLTIEGYQQYLDQYWRGGLWSMINHVTGKSTIMEWTDYQFQTDMAARDFTKTGLKRVR